MAIDMEFIKLNEIATIRASGRSPQVENIEDVSSYSIVNPRDIPQCGFIPLIDVCKEGDDLQIDHQALRQSDILLSTRGVIGKVGIIETWYEPLIASPAFAIISLKSEKENLKKEAIAFYMFLKSDKGQELINQLVYTGGNFTKIRVADLREMNVPVLTENFCDDSIKDFYKEIKLYEDIEAIKEEIQNIHHNNNIRLPVIAPTLLKEAYRSSFENFHQKVKDSYSQCVFLLNGMDKQIEKEYENSNRNARFARSVIAYSYSTYDKNLYVDYSVRGSMGGGTDKKLLIDYASDGYKNKFATAAETKEWSIIYEHTKFLINLGSDRAWFSFQFIPYEQKFFSKPFAIITAHNPNMQRVSDKENQQQLKKLSNYLKKMRYDFNNSLGELSGHEEESFIIFGISLNDALKLGEKFQQESIVYNDTKSISIIDCSNSEKLLFLDYQDVYSFYS